MSNYSTYARKGLKAVLAVIGFVVVSQQATAASFAVKEQSVTYLGNAFAGTSSAALDASTGFYNPAGLSELKHDQLVVAATYLKARVKLYNATTKDTLGTTRTGNLPTRPKSSALVPGLHLSHKVNNKYSVGLSVVAPFGLSTKYTAGDIARYMATESKLSTVDVSPSVSYKLNNRFSIGAALDFMRVKATLASNTRVASEGRVINKASGWTYGYHFGLLYKPSAVTKIGLAYFSGFTPRVKGSELIVNVPGRSSATLTANMKLPDRINYSVTHKYTDEWTTMGEIEWTHWSQLKLLRLNFSDGNNSTEYFFYKNAFRLSLGADYKYSGRITLKSGISFEQTPVQNDYRSARVPDSDRLWLALGVKYKYNKHVSIDAGYAHVFFNNATIAQQGVANRSALYGNYKSSADIVGLQLTWNFV